MRTLMEVMLWLRDMEESEPYNNYVVGRGDAKEIVLIALANLVRKEIEKDAI